MKAAPTSEQGLPGLQTWKCGQSGRILSPAQACRATLNSARASSGVAPKAEQNWRSGISAMYPPSSALKKMLMW
jgi:hypothetical protein